MMRTAIVLFAAALTFPALAQDGTPYTDAERGFSITIPAGFESTAEIPAGTDNGDVLTRENETLSVWGGLAENGPYDAEIERRLDFLLSHGWEVVDSETTAEHAYFMIASGAWQMTSFAIPTCDGKGFAAYQYEFDPEAHDWVMTDADLRNSLVATEAC